MQVFKSYFKVLNKYKGQMILYLCIFSGLLALFMNTQAKDSTNNYSEKKCEFEIFDYDNSKSSKALTLYLEETNKRVSDTIEINDNKTSMQDALYNREADAIIRIPEGFEEKLLAGEIDGDIDFITIPGTQNSMLIEADLNSFLSVFSKYIKAGYEVDDAVSSTKLALAETVKVTLPDGENVSARSKSYSFFSYIGWALMCMIITSVASVLQVFSKNELKNRIECSSYNFLNYNKELVLGTIVTGLVTCGVFFALAVVFIKDTIFSMQGALFFVNMISYLCVCISVSFLISKITTSQEILSMIANVVSLGMAFLCGIFVPIEFLGKGVIKVAHFLPAFWYNKAVIAIDDAGGLDYRTIFSSMGIQLLFAIAIITVGLVISRRKVTA